MKPEDLTTIHELQREIESAWRDVNLAQARLQEAQAELQHAREYVMTLLSELEDATRGRL